MKVAVLMGSANDQPKMAPAVKTLASFGVDVTEHVLSAHQTPSILSEFARTARERGYGALICGAGMAAHLAAAMASHTTLPVIGVPLSESSVGGLDALYATVQMPEGTPVATVAIDGSANAALLAVAIGAVADEQLARKLDEYRAHWLPQP